MTRSLWLWPTIIVISAVGVGLVTFRDVESPVRGVIALWFLLICPGMAFTRLLRVSEVFTELALAVALSLAIDAIVAGTMIYAGAWSPEWILVGLISISMIGVAVQIATARDQLLDVARKRSANRRSA